MQLDKAAAVNQEKLAGVQEFPTVTSEPKHNKKPESIRSHIQFPKAEALAMPS